jgi:PAS domain S-box-containing protein
LRERSRVFWAELRSFFSRPDIQTRTSLCLVGLALSWFYPLLGPPTEITLWIGGYLLSSLLVILLGTVLRGDRTGIATRSFRAVPELLDVALISVIISYTGRFESPWFLLYLFPVMSVSRYLGRRGSATMALIEILAYSVVVAGGDSALPVTAFGIRAVVLIGAALTAGNLSRQRHEDASLLKVVDKIDRQILNNADVSQLIRTILRSAMEVTDSKISALALIDAGRVSERGIYAEATSISPVVDRVRARELIRENAHLLFQTGKKSLGLPMHQSLRLSRMDDPHRWSGRLILLEVDDRAVGILGVFSREIVHYTENDVQRLASMAPLVELARKHASVFAELKEREQNSKERLQLLYDIGENLATERGLNVLFKNVVRLVSEHMRSEEAALFLPDEFGHRIVKQAVWGPDAGTRRKLEALETAYIAGDNSLTRRVFDGVDLALTELIPEFEAHAEGYRNVLPSGQTRHYLAAQLRIGSEVLGVIRVLNKRAQDYAVDHALLAPEGFDYDDQDLLNMIATQVAAAIRSASFIERHRYFEDVVYRSPDPIVITDENGRIRYFNRQAERIWNRSENEVRNEPVANFYSSADEARRVGRALWQAEDHAITDFMTEILVGEEVVPVRLSASLLMENGTLAGSIGLFTEQTERLRTVEEEQLAALAQMARSLGHAIKNDLGAIENRLESLKHKAQDDPVILKYYMAIRQLTTSVRSKLGSMLAASKPQPLPRKTLLSFSRLLQEFAASVLPEATDAEIAFELSPPDRDVSILGDAEPLHEVLVNLFVNSVDAIKSAREMGRSNAGHVSVATALDSQTSRVSVEWQDDGVGMSADTVRKAFAPYYTTKQTGTGLGLFHSRRTIENHGGSIAVRSTEGVGTRFRITLPLAATTEPEGQQDL